MSPAARKQEKQEKSEELLGKFPEDRRLKVLKIRELIRNGEYDVEGKFEAIFDDLLDDILKG